MKIKYGFFRKNKYNEKIINEMKCMKNNKLKKSSKLLKENQITEPLINVELHEMEDMDMRGYDYPGEDEPAVLPNWPSHMSTKPYKL